MKKQWFRLQNPFATAVRKSFIKAVSVSTNHDARLEARTTDPFFAAMYATFHPLHLALVEAYNTWKLSTGDRKAATKALALLIVKLRSVKINQWAPQVMIVFEKNTPGYTRIFPRGHKPYQSGSKFKRVTAVQQLSLQLRNIPALATTKADVDDFAVELDNVWGASEGKSEVINMNSVAVKKAVNAAMKAMFINFNSCMNQFPDNPQFYESLFDLEKVRRRQQTHFDQQIAEEKAKTIAKRTLKPNQKIRIKSTGAATIIVCVTAIRNKPGTGGVSVAPGGEVEVFVESLGDITRNKFLTVFNPDTVEGSFEITLV